MSALKVFSSVNIGMTPKDTNLIDCSISLAQSKLQGVKLNLEASTNSSGLFGISPQLSYYHKNIFKGGEWLNLSFLGNFQFKFKDKVRSNEFGASASLSLPRFFPLPYRYFKGDIPRTDINISYNYQNRPEYTRNILSTSYGYTGDIDNKFFYQVYPMQLNVVRLMNLDNDFYENLAADPFLRNAYQDHFDLGSGGTLYYTTNLLYCQSLEYGALLQTAMGCDILYSSVGETGEIPVRARRREVPIKTSATRSSGSGTEPLDEKSEKAQIVAPSRNTRRGGNASL